MPPKNKGKKGKKGGDDDGAYWDAKAAALEAKSPLGEVDDDDAPPKPAGKKSAGASNLFDLIGDDEDDGGGGLLATIQASSSKKKDKKAKKKAAQFDLDEEDGEGPNGEAAAAVDTKPNLDDEWPEDEVKPKKSKKDKSKKSKRQPEEDDEAPEPEGIVEAPVSTEVNLDDEWPEEDVKPKKGKKGKKDKKQKAEEDDEDWYVGNQQSTEVKAAPTPAAAPAPPEPEPVKDEVEEDAAEDDDGPKILTKAQKEKLKKEKEKAKKKAQAAAKKAATADEPSSPAPPTTETVPTTNAPAEDDDDEEEGGAAGGDKKKKKKKKGAAAAPAPEPAAAAKKGKVPAHIAAMQAAMEERKRIEEEAKRQEEERIRKIEEEDARIAAEEARIAEQKAAKKAKEKEKQAKAKAEGRLLTPKEKREKAAAEARKQAMLASGMTVAALQDGGDKKKPMYGKKKPQAAPKAKAEEEVKEKEEPKPKAPEPAPEEVEKEANGDDDWDKSGDEAVAQVTKGLKEVKVDESGDDWDKSEDEDEEPVPASPAAAKVDAAPSTTPAAAKSATPVVKAPEPVSPVVNGKAATNGKPAPKVAADEESSEEDDSDDDSDEDDSDDESESEDEAEKRKADARKRIQERAKAAEAAKSKEDLRSPICCILGHVDTGKTKLLDKEGEAGGITQQIGATFFPKAAISEKTEVVNKNHEYEIKIPGLLIIDTPGHESFTNLRSRGSSLCNIAILVVDITHGLEPQTIESLNLLRNGKTPFIVALNKIDRMYGWKPIPNGGFRETLAQQDKSVRSEFEDRVRKTKLAFSEQGLNAEIFDENKNLGRNISLVPTSAITGEGIPDMLMLLVKLTQERMNQSLMYISELECTILEVKIIEGLGTTIDVVLSNGVMREGDRIVLCGMDGPIVTNVRALLTPQPLRELRVKEVKAALGVKISAPGLEKAIAGARLYVAQDDDEVEAYKDLAMEDLTSLARFVEKSGKGVWVQASTLGSLEALLTFLQQMKIPVYNFGIGPIFKNTIVRAATMLDRAPEYAVILSFDVALDKEAEELAKKAGMKIFSAMIIYHLFDAFTKYMNEVQEAKRQAALPNAVWPVRLSIIKAFALRDPIVLGVDLIEGSLRTGTPVGVIKKYGDGRTEIVKLGKITSIEINHKPMDIVKKAQIGAGAAIKIERAPHEAAKLYGRHFDDKDEVVSLLSRVSIDTLKNNFRDKTELTDWAIIKKMKVEQNIQ